VLINDVTDPEGPGAKAGLQAGDVVTEFNGQKVSRSAELQRLVGRCAGEFDSDFESSAHGQSQT
jgi:S1-C subfamily serine protease